MDEKTRGGRNLGLDPTKKFIPKQYYITYEGEPY